MPLLLEVAPRTVVLIVIYLAGLVTYAAMTMQYPSPRPDGLRRSARAVGAAISEPAL